MPDMKCACWPPLNTQQSRLFPLARYPRPRRPGPSRRCALRRAGSGCHPVVAPGKPNAAPTGELPEPPATGDDSDAREVTARLIAILEKLSPESSRVFHLRFVEGKELSDVAKAMGFSLATAKRHLARVSARVHTMARNEPALAAYARATIRSDE